jgi:hypothetical protein
MQFLSTQGLSSQGLSSRFVPYVQKFIETMQSCRRNPRWRTPRACELVVNTGFVVTLPHPCYQLPPRGHLPNPWGKVFWRRRVFGQGCSTGVPSARVGGVLVRRQYALLIRISYSEIKNEKRLRTFIRAHPVQREDLQVWRGYGRCQRNREWAKNSQRFRMVSEPGRPKRGLALLLGRNRSAAGN